MPENREHLSIVPPLDVEVSAAVRTAELPSGVGMELGLLTLQEQEVMRLRLGLDTDNPRTDAEVARRLGMLVPSVALSEIRALNKLRNSGNTRIESQSETD